MAMTRSSTFKASPAGPLSESSSKTSAPGRAHFLVLLTPSALEHCGDPKDWLRREIETAMESRRNVGALKNSAKAIRLKPDYAEAYYNRGNTRGDKGDHDGALKDYAKA